MIFDLPIWGGPVAPINYPRKRIKLRQLNVRSTKIFLLWVDPCRFYAVRFIETRSTTFPYGQIRSARWRLRSRSNEMRKTLQNKKVNDVMIKMTDIWVTVRPYCPVVEE
jgi:hypothetical protein